MNDERVACPGGPYKFVTGRSAKNVPEFSGGMVMKFGDHNVDVLPYIIMLFIALTGCAASKEANFDNVAKTPKSFKNREVEIEGFFRYGVEPILYKSKSSDEAPGSANGIVIQDKSIENRLEMGCGNQSVKVRGEVIKHHDRTMLINISRIYSVDNNRICWEPRVTGKAPIEDQEK